MADWTTNTIMLWSGNKISDHGRSSLNMESERIGTDVRMADATLRRFFVKNKRSWSTSWENIPSSNVIAAGIKTVDGGYSGEEMEEFYNTTPGVFRLVLRRGSASGITTPTEALDLGDPYEDDNFYGVDVMITQFSKETVKRGIVDLWNINVTLEEV